MTRTTIALLATLAAAYLYWRGNVYRDALRVLSRHHAEMRRQMTTDTKRDPRRVEWVVKQI